MTTSLSSASAQPWPKVAVIGAGAVGGYFGGLLARAGAPVVMIGRKSFADAVNTRGLVLDTLQFKETVWVTASTELAAARGAELVLFCVKTTDTVAVARELAPYLAPGAQVICLQNGVDNAEKIRAETGIQATAAVVYVAASVPAPGEVKHVGRGDLILGPDTPAMTALAARFAAAGVPCRIAPNIEGELWAKFMCNCALNAISALGHATYGQIGADVGTRELVKAVIDEVFAVAEALRLVLPGMEDRAKARAGVFKLTTQISGAYSSTAQDLQRGKPTEIDALNGYIVRRGIELGVPTPVNRTLLTLVRLAERKADGKPATGV